MPVARIAGFDLEVGTLSGLVGAAAIACGAARPTWRSAGLPRLLVPVARLGRMSLSVYVLQTVVYVALAAAGWRGGDWAVVIRACGAALLVNFAFSRWWLSRFRTGPLEFLLRWATHLRRPAMRMGPPAPQALPPVP